MEQVHVKDEGYRHAHSFLSLMKRLYLMEFKGKFEGFRFTPSFETVGKHEVLLSVMGEAEWASVWQMPMPWTAQCATYARTDNPRVPTKFPPLYAMYGIFEGPEFNKAPRRRAVLTATRDDLMIHYAGLQEKSPFAAIQGAVSTVDRGGRPAVHVPWSAIMPMADEGVLFLARSILNAVAIDPATPEDVTAAWAARRPN